MLVPSCWPLGVLINPPQVNDDNDDVSDDLKMITAMKMKTKNDDDDDDDDGDDDNADDDGDDDDDYVCFCDTGSLQPRTVA